MRDLAINRQLDDDTRKQGIWINGIVYSLHITHNNEVIITDNHDYTIIYQVTSLDFWRNCCE
jgi:hypothetical protein